MSPDDRATAVSTLDIFLVSPPGLESTLQGEAVELGFAEARRIPGGVVVSGNWSEAWRANLDLRGAVRVLVRIAEFRVTHLAQLDKRARRFDWATHLRADCAVRVDAVCRKSKLYHAGAVRQRVETAIRDELGAEVSPEAEVSLKVRLDHDVCTISIDTSGEGLHKRGHKPAVAKAPMRETLAALFLRECGFDGRETVLDPMCGSGTFLIEAAEMARGLAPGRSREFAFEYLPSFDAADWAAMKAARQRRDTDLRVFGSDRDAGAVRMSRANLEAAGVGDHAEIVQRDIADLEPPDAEPGLVIINPPYGARIGNKKRLYALYDTLGSVLRRRFSGWRVGLVTSDDALARATRLPFGKPGPYVDHGGIKIRLYQTPELK